MDYETLPNFNNRLEASGEKSVHEANLRKSLALRTRDFNPWVQY